MRLKIAIAAAIVAAFILGATFDGYVKPTLNNALTSPPLTVTAMRRVASAPPAVARAAQPSVVASQPQAVQHHRHWERQVLIVAGSSGAGTAIGAVAGGKKGAAIGALSGGVAGLVYDLATRNR